MRFAEIELIKYGHFENKKLQFPAHASDFHIIFGPNEAGKSTTLAAINDLLFGFPNQTAFDFRFDKQLLRIGATISDDSSVYIVRRKKGRVGTLLDDRDQVIDDAPIVAMLAGNKTESFQRMFSLNHERLREGGRAILEAQDNIGQAIFAAGSGLVAVNSVLNALEAESKQIWTKRSGNDRRYYIAQQAYDDARKRVKEALIKPSAWSDLHRKIIEISDQIKVLKSRRNDLLQVRHDIERQRRLLPQVVLYKQLTEQIRELGEVRDFPDGSDELLASVNVELASLSVEKKIALEDADRLRQELEKIQTNQVILDNANEIEKLHELKGSIDKGLIDLPRLQENLGIKLEKLAEIQCELGWPHEPARLVKNRMPQKIRVSDVRNLLENRMLFDATDKNIKNEQLDLKLSLEKLNRELKDLPEDKNYNEVITALKHASTYGDLQRSVLNAKIEVKRRQDSYAAAVTQLQPWTGDLNTLKTLTLPTNDATISIINAVNTFENSINEIERELKTLLNRKAKFELQRVHLERDDKAISPQVVIDLRVERDILWSRIKSYVIDQISLSNSEEVVERYELGLHAADEVADKRFLAAEQSAQLTSLQKEIENNDLDLDQKKKALQDAKSNLELVLSDWQKLIESLKIKFSVKEYGTWLERRQRAIDIGLEYEEATNQLASVEATLQENLKRIKQALESIGITPQKEISYDHLVEFAHHLIKVFAEEGQKRRDIENKIASTMDLWVQSDKKSKDLSENNKNWELAWIEATKSLGLDSKSSHAIVRAQLELIDEMRVEIELILGLENRIAGIERDVRQFDSDVAKLADTCRIIKDNSSSFDLLKTFKNKLRDSIESENRYQKTTKDLSNRETKIQECINAKDRQLARLQPLFEIAGANDRELLASSISRFKKVKDFLDEERRLRNEIINAGEGQDLQNILTETENSEIGFLETKSREIDESINDLSSNIEDLAAQHARFMMEFSKMDSGPDAAVAAADVEQAKSDMSLQAEAYIRKRAEILLLRWAINRYRSEKQNPLLARASDIFSKLTLNNYKSLFVDLDGDNPKLASLTQDQAVISVEGMSEGTVDQLFLALRIAAVEDSINSGARLPFLADDLFINYDDDRAAAGFQVLYELSKRTQVLFFTHHQHLATVAKRALGDVEYSYSIL